ncbi:MAG: acetyl-CoA C-acyltransferase, partial [Acidobacteria bacterium]|nr:acetyl-CoA C-acyltransferase [Acidobacteriota bacterium]
MARPVRSPRRKTPPSSSPTTYVVAGARTPFLRSGTDYVDTLAYELGVFAVKGLLEKTDLDPASVERLTMGCVLAEPRTTNVAREIVLAAGLPQSVPASTVTAACISANVAIASIHEAIAAGSLGVAIAGGVETLSDVPIRYQRSVRKRLIASQKAKSPVDYMKLLSGLKPQDLLPETPAIAEFSTGQTMGESAERLAKRLGISREAQDAFAAASHQQAHAAHEKGRYAEQIVPVRVAPRFGELTRDNGVRGDTTPEKLAGLSPAFDKRFGSVTAGNSSFLTDGAAACLLASGARVKALGLTPLARIVSTAWV